MNRRDLLVSIGLAPIAWACRRHAPMEDVAMNLFIFARFHARSGREDEVARVLREQVDDVRVEPGCKTIEAYRSTRDPRMFYIHSIWADEAAFEVHAELPRTVAFIARIEPLIDHPLDVTRARPI